MPPSLSVNVGVPPATVTASLIVRVKVTTWPAFRSPLPLVIPEPDVATDITVGADTVVVGADGVVVGADTVVDVDVSRRMGTVPIVTSPFTMGST